MNATADYPIHELIAKRWSPYCFDERSVTDEDLRSLFAAARLAPSFCNEQPWSYIVAKKENYEEFFPAWWKPTKFGQRQPLRLALGITSLKFTRNGKPNRAAIHDLGPICRKAS